MAKFSVAVLFLYFTLSLAENDVNHLQLASENDVVRPEHPNTLPESDDFKPIKSDAEETRSVHPMPFNFVRFRPINRRFGFRSQLPFRLCGHPGSRRQIPYGNDMILSSTGKNVDFDKFVYRVGMTQIPEKRFNLHRHHHDDHKEEKKMSKFLDDRQMFGKMKLKNQSDDDDDDHEEKKVSKFQIYYSRKNKNELDDEANDKHSEDHYRKKLRKRFHYRNSEEGNKWEKKKGGITRSIRKFLHHYFD